MLVSMNPFAYPHHFATLGTGWEHWLRDVGGNLNELYAGGEVGELRVEELSRDEC